MKATLLPVVLLSIICQITVAFENNVFVESSFKEKSSSTTTTTTKSTKPKLSRKKSKPSNDDKSSIVLDGNERSVYLKSLSSGEYHTRPGIGGLFPFNVTDGGDHKQGSNRIIGGTPVRKFIVHCPLLFHFFFSY